MIRRLTTLDDLCALAPAWRHLAAAVPDATIFQAPDWCIEWWRAFGRGALHVLVAWSGRTLAGLAPFFIESPHDGRRPCLSLIGTGNSDCLDVLAIDGATAATLCEAAFAEAARHGWEIGWRRLPARSALRRTPGPGEVAPETPCPSVSLPLSHAALDTSLGHEFRRSLRRGRRALDRAGAVTLEILRGGAVSGGIDDLYRLHASRWRAADGSQGVLADPVVQGFHRGVAGRLDGIGALRVIRMRVGGDTAAIYYGFRWGTRAAAYLSGFDPRWAAASPGRQLLHGVMRLAIDEGVRDFDFLSGRETYKYDWGAVDEPYFMRTT